MDLESHVHILGSHVDLNIHVPIWTPNIGLDVNIRMYEIQQHDAYYDLC